MKPAVFRGLYLGDMVAATPALRALGQVADRLPPGPLVVVHSGREAVARGAGGSRRMKMLDILTWRIPGSYLNTLVQAPHRFYPPTKLGRLEGYGGREPTFSWSPGPRRSRGRRLEL